MARLTLIAPNIVMQKGDYFGSGIPYMPLTLSYTASYMRSKGHSITLIDSFGENPFSILETKKHYIQGLRPDEIVRRIDRKSEFLIISAERLVAHQSVINIIKKIRETYIIPIIIIENTQAVTSYSLQKVYDEFIRTGASYILTGEPEERAEELIDALKHSKPLDNIDGLIYRKGNKTIAQPKTQFIKDLDSCPFPAWDLFPLENYFTLEYSHAPLTSRRYLPLLTSRGCPYMCSFCVIPGTNSQKWRARSAKNVVDEIEHSIEKYGVTEFHIEDLNPTIRKERIIEICREIIDRGLKVTWKLGSGTKIETIDKETLGQMKKAGCAYISISPESGSPRILKLMRKPFDHEFALGMVKEMDRLGISSQACFVLGHPGENRDDLDKTRQYIRKLAKAGIDEIALFILTPAPGSSIFESSGSPKKLNELTFSPEWRKDYKFYHNTRLKLYILFLMWKLMYHPIKAARMVLGIITRKFNTKIEMTIFRTFKIMMMKKVAANE